MKYFFIKTRGVLVSVTIVRKGRSPIHEFNEKLRGNYKKRSRKCGVRGK